VWPHPKILSEFPLVPGTSTVLWIKHEIFINIFNKIDRFNSFLNNTYFKMNTLLRRGEFSKDTKLSLIRKFALCQLCGSRTKCGQFAHIVTLNDKGPRNKHALIHDGTISSSYRISDKWNCLYLCPNCHTTIDNHPEIYTYKYLNDVKTKHNNHEIPQPETEPRT
jgi:hypothetical protein